MNITAGVSAGHATKEQVMSTEKPVMSTEEQVTSQQSADLTIFDAEDLVDTTGLVEVSSGASPPQGTEEEAPEEVRLARIHRHDVLVRAQSWINEHVMYSQSHYHTNRYGHYRQDCSGYVSMCWHLPRSYVTWTIMQVAHRISWAQLLPGDALWNHSAQLQHIALFVGWADKAHREPVVQEEYDTGHPCSRRKWSHSWAARFSPIRYNHIV
jgi:hypothetical protein